MNYLSSQIQCILDIHALKIIHTTIISALIIIGIYYLNKFAQNAITKLQASRKLDKSLLKIFQNVIVVLIYGLGLILLLQNLDIKMSALLGAVGIITVGIGVALQKIIGNMASGIFILFYKPFAIGDYISCEHPNSRFEGKIIHINLRLTTLEYNDDIVLIPNHTLYDAIIVVKKQTK